MTHRDRPSIIADIVLSTYSLKHSHYQLYSYNLNEEEQRKLRSSTVSAVIRARF